jgi:2,3-bisphosphoglycerate-independent phosphoglycerate mutase
MSAPGVKDAIVAEINAKSADFICLNFANGDMVGHTGVYTAIQTAVKAIDQCVNEVVTAARSNNYDVVIIADHGNADNALNEDGSENTAHSLNPVPCIWVTDQTGARLRNGILADVAPTLLTIMGLEVPSDMSGNILIEK